MKKWAVSLGLFILLGIFTVILLNGFGPKKISPISFDKTEFIASVNGQGVNRQEYEAKLEEKKNFFLSQKQDPSALTSLENDVLDTMIDEALVVNYAKEKNITVTDIELGTRYDQVVAGYNRNNKVKSGETEFLAAIKKLYGTEKSDYLQTIKMDILREKVQKSVGKPLVKWLKEEKIKASISRY